MLVAMELELDFYDLVVSRLATVMGTVWVGELSQDIRLVDLVVPTAFSLVEVVFVASVVVLKVYPGLTLVVVVVMVVRTIAFL